MKKMDASRVSAAVATAMPPEPVVKTPPLSPFKSDSTPDQVLHRRSRQPRLTPEAPTSMAPRVPYGIAALPLLRANSKNLHAVLSAGSAARARRSAEPEPLKTEGGLARSLKTSGDSPIPTTRVRTGHTGLPLLDTSKVPRGEPDPSSSANTLVDSATSGTTLVDSRKWSASSRGGKHVKVPQLQERALLARMGLHRDEAENLLDLIRRDCEALEKAAIPDLDHYRVQTGRSTGLRAALSSMDSCAPDIREELNGAKDFAGTRMLVALQQLEVRDKAQQQEHQRRQTRREKLLGKTLAKYFPAKQVPPPAAQDSLELLEKLRQAQEFTRQRARLDRADDGGAYSGDVMNGLFKMRRESVLLGFKAEPTAIDDRDHVLWKLASELQLGLEPEAVRRSIGQH
jgi:hypothetical protein